MRRTSGTKTKTAKTASISLLVVALMGQALAGTARPSQKPALRTDAVQIALDHARAQRTQYGLRASDVAELSVTDAYRSSHNGVTHVYLRQNLHGLEVAESAMTVNITRDGEVLHVGSRFLPGLRTAASGRVDLSAAQAVSAAARQLDLPAPRGLRVLKSSQGVARTTLMSGAGTSISRIPARLVYQPTPGRGLRLAWNLEIEEHGGEHWWNLSVDATTGEILSKLDYVTHDDASATAAAVGPRDAHAQETIVAQKPSQDGSEYRVYALPLESPNDGERKLIKNPADALASPYGWHDTDGKRGYDHTTTRGNNVLAYTEYTGVGNRSLPMMEADGGEGLDFDFPIDFAMPPQSFREAAVTNLFYWSNVTHDLLYRYGFTERAGNFQVNNYGRGGKGADDVQAEGQDGGGVNNANFATPADGSKPRMQMYLWPNPNKRGLIDGDFDAGVIIHEYGHGVSNRLTGGPAKVDCVSGYDEREGEGWSDFLSIALTARKGEKGTDARGMGTYVLGQASRKEKGIRATPYSTNKNINPATYNSIKTAVAPHGVGYVWATMLWEVYWKLTDKHGFNPNPYGSWKTGGNNLAIQLVMDGMKMQPCDPGFVDARNAILAAERALTKGKNKCLVWAAFAKRGLGYKADQRDKASKTDGTEDFSTHPSCR